MALALGEDRDEHIGAGHFLAAGRLNVNDRALNDPLEAGGGLGVLRAVGHQIVELGFEISDERPAQLFQIDVARPHDGGGVLILDQRKKQMLKRRIFVVALVCERQCAMKRLFKAARKRRHFHFSSFELD